MSESIATLKRKPSLDIDSPMPSSGPPSPSANDSDSNNEQAKVKRVRTLAEKTKTVAKMIATLSNTQLVDLVSTLVESHPSLLEDITRLVPRPTVASVQTVVTSLEAKLLAAYPYTKWGPGRDDYSFNRVKPALDELVDTLIEYSNHFTSPPEFPTTSFSFLHIATECCHRLPTWDTPANNQIKLDTYKTMQDFWIKAIQEAASKLDEGKIFGQITVQEWAKNLEQHNITTQGSFSRAIEEFKNKLGWVIGIQPSVPSFSNSTSNSPLPNFGGNSSNGNNNGSNHLHQQTRGGNGNDQGGSGSEGNGSPFLGQNSPRQHQRQQQQRQMHSLRQQRTGLGFHIRQ
ncbi:Tethering factor for nuclear proteasome sts1 [Gryganskiella cystojenkinii]|nr:Tethering factor for nuclear proteasome sts1 [Gryganskiella cystojenkinii]